MKAPSAGTLWLDRGVVVAAPGAEWSMGEASLAATDEFSGVDDAAVLVFEAGGPKAAFCGGVELVGTR
jgi:hypothetical protein